MENEIIEGKKWIGHHEGVDTFQMNCPLDCGCIVLCTQNIYDGHETADCPNCGDITMTAWSEGGEG